VTTQTENQVDAKAWEGILPLTMAQPLSAAGISPHNVEAKTCAQIIAIKGCGWGTVRQLARRDLWLSDLPAFGRDCAIEWLKVPLGVYQRLKELALESVFDFIARRLDGASLIAKGFTINEVASVRQALDDAGTSFADLSSYRTLGHIRFDARVTVALEEHGISPATSLQHATMQWVLERLGPDLDGLQEKRIAYAYWRMGYERLGE
jgi:hypothetical protein